MESSLVRVIKPARREAQLIERTLISVVQQTAHQARRVVVSDGSPNGTAEIVKGYCVRRDWIKLVRMPERREQHLLQRSKPSMQATRKSKTLDLVSSAA
jgi:glycosyltransferase involved in cell wall biosynthesis